MTHLRKNIIKYLENIFYKENNTTKHLWESNHKYLYLESSYDHFKKDGPYENWYDFIDTKAYECNCLIGNPILYWYWRIAGVYDESDIRLTDEEIKELKDDESFDFERDTTTYESDLLTLLYYTWFGTDLVKIEIKVTQDDENNVREFLKEHGLSDVWRNI